MPRLPARLLLVALCTALTLVGSAQAEVTRGAGFSATVDGYRGWFGSYQMAQLGTMWCVDHGLAPPDPAHGYRPVELTDHPAPVRRAMAWALGRHGHEADRVAAAALMLVLHDLAGQRYPGGPLELERLGAERLEGFEGAGPLVLARARTMKSDALAHSRHEGPFRLTVESAAVRAGETATMVARLTDRAGAGVAGISLHASSTPRRASMPASSRASSPQSGTDARGEQRFSFTAAPGANRFEISGMAPDMVLQSFAPTGTSAQRVARASQARVATTAVVNAQSARLTIRKVNDAPAYLATSGARFEVRARGPDGSFSIEAGRVTTDGDGATPPLALAPGTYQVMETTPPPGHRAGGPWVVEMGGSDVTLQAENAALRGSLAISKVDAETGHGLAGAVISLAYDPDANGSFQTSIGRPIGTVTTGDGPVLRADLLPGDYQLTETASPPGYRPFAGATTVSVRPGQTTTVRLANRRVGPAPGGPFSSGVSSGAPEVDVPRPAAPGGELAATGQPLTLLSGVALGLMTGGSTLVGIAAHPWRRARRRARAHLRKT